MRNRIDFQGRSIADSYCYRLRAWHVLPVARPEHPETLGKRSQLNQLTVDSIRILLARSVTGWCSNALTAVALTAASAPVGPARHIWINHPRVTSSNRGENRGFQRGSSRAHRLSNDSLGGVWLIGALWGGEGGYVTGWEPGMCCR